ISILHDRGVDGFVKSTQDKHWVGRIPIGVSLYEAMDGMAYSFIDGGPKLVVQEFIPMKYEHRFFVVDRRIATDSPVQTRLTPIDHPLPEGSVSPTPTAKHLDVDLAAYAELKRVAEE